MKIGLRSKGDARCPYCHDQVAAEESQTCGGCHTTLHSECADELTKCPTMGCGRSLSGRGRPRAPRRAPAVGVVGVRGGGGGGDLAMWWEENSRTLVGVVSVALVAMCLYSLPAGDSTDSADNRNEPPALALPAHRGRVHDALGCRFEVGRPGYVDLVVTRWKRRTPLKLLIPIAVPLVPVGHDPARRPILMTSSWFEKPITGPGRYPVPAVAIQPRGWARPPGGPYDLRWNLKQNPPWMSQVEALLKTLRTRLDGHAPRWPNVQVAVLAVIALRSGQKPVPMPTSEQILAGEGMLRLVGHEAHSHVKRLFAGGKIGASGDLDQLLKRFASLRPRGVAALRPLKAHLGDARVRKLLFGYLRQEGESALHASVLAFLRESRGLPLNLAGHWRLIEKEPHRVVRLAVIESLLARGVRAVLPLRLAYEYDRLLSREFNRSYLRKLGVAGRVPKPSVSLLADWKAREGKLGLRDLRVRTLLGEVEKAEREFVEARLAQLGLGAEPRVSAMRRAVERIGSHPQTIQRLRELARKATNPSARGVAIDLLSSVPEARPLGLLVEVIAKDPQQHVRVRALRYRGRLSFPERAKLWAAAAKNDMPAVRGAVLDELRRQRSLVERHAGKTTRATLLALSQDKADWIRKQAVVWVFRLRMPEAVAVVRETLRGKQAADVTQALGLLPLLAENYRYSRQAMQAKQLIADAAGRHRSPIVRDVALTSLARFGYTSWLRDVLLERLRKDSQLIVQRRALSIAARALRKRVGTTRGFAQVLRAGLSPVRSVRVRQYAADRVRSSKVESLKRDLVRLGERAGEAKVRVRAFQALAGWHDDLALAVLATWLRSGAAAEKLRAVKLLARYYPRRTIRIRSMLKPYAKGSDRALRVAIENYLKR